MPFGRGVDYCYRLGLDYAYSSRGLWARAMPILAAGERQIDQVIAYGAGRRGTLYLTDRRLIFEWSEGLVAKRYQQLGIALSDLQAVNAAHATFRGNELVITTKDANNGFRASQITFGIAMAPEVWMTKINNLLVRSTSPPGQPTVIIEREIEREVVRTPCRYCGSLVDAFRSDKCPNCGAPLR